MAAARLLLLALPTAALAAVLADSAFAAPSADLYEHYFPAADRVSKCQALDGNQTAVDVRDPNAADPAANVSYFCHTRGDGDVCYLRKDGNHAAGITGLRTHPGGFTFSTPDVHRPPPVCSVLHPPCLDSSGAPDNSKNPFTENCTGAPPMVFISTSINGTVSAAWEGGADLQDGETVSFGATVTFTATPDDDYELSRWTGGCRGALASELKCAFAVTTDVTVGAEFAAPFPVSIFITDSPNGTVSAASAADPQILGGETVSFGAAVTFTARPDADHAAARWTGGCAGDSIGDGRCVLAPTAHVTVGADFVFAPASVAVFITDSPDGTVSAASAADPEILSGEIVAASAVVTFTAAPAPGYELARWTGACAGDSDGDLQCAFAVTTDVTVGAEFVRTPRVVNYSKLPGGQAGNGGTLAEAEGRASGFQVASGATVTFTATPNDGWTVTWNPESGCDDNDSACEIIASGDLNVVAIFDAGNDALVEKYFPAAERNRHCGILNANALDLTQPGGTLGGLECYPNTAPFVSFCIQLGGAFDPALRLSDDDGSDVRSYGFPPLCSAAYPDCEGGQVKQDGNPFAACVAPPAVFITASPGGTVSAERAGDAEVQSGEAVPFGATVTFTARPAAGHRFSIWTGDCAGEANSQCVLDGATTDVTVGAEFGCTDDFHGASQNLASVKCNLEAGKNVNERDRFGGTALHWAAFNGLPAVVSLLLERDADVNARDNITGATPLHDAAGAGPLEVVALLLSASPSLNARDNQGRAPLTRALGDGREEVFRLLVASGAHHGTDCAALDPPLTVNPRSATPPCLSYVSVSVAASSGGTVSISWSGDADVRGGEGVMNGATVTFAALPDGGYSLSLWGGICDGAAADSECVREVTTDATVSVLFSCTDLHAAAAAGNLEGLNCILAAGGDVNARDGSDRTPLHLAAGEGRLEAAQRLLTLGAAVNATDADGDTPLTEAAARGHSAVFALLAALGGRHAGSACGASEVPNPSGASPPCVSCGANKVASGGLCECDADFGLISGRCVHRENAPAQNRETCAEIFGGDWVDLSAAHGSGKGVCSGIDINDTFCLAGTGSALPCLGLFGHVRDCNLLGRPALDPWHCAAACAGGKASGARCLE